MTDHPWLGDEDGHNCVTCQERDDTLHLCWPQAHICGLCEKVPGDWPDIFCAPCRAEADAHSDTVTDPIERLLSDHARVEFLSDTDSTVCRCDLRFDGGPGYHRRHVAELIYDALGIDGPVPWDLGSKSATRAKFDEHNRIKADA